MYSLSATHIQCQKNAARKNTSEAVDDERWRATLTGEGGGEERREREGERLEDMITPSACLILVTASTALTHVGPKPLNLCVYK